MAAGEVIASDLLEVFGGIFPEEDLAKDEPLLAAIAQELISEHEGDLNAVLQDIIVAGTDCEPAPAPNSELSKEDKIEEVLEEKPDKVSATKPEEVVQKPEGVVDECICMACKGPSEGIRSFGALVCMSCRAFFVRSIKNKGYEKFVCKQAKSQQHHNQRELCPINSRSWKSCKRCRFDQCLKVGMKIPDNKKKNTETRICLPDNKNSIQSIKNHYIKIFMGKMRLYNDVSSQALSIMEFERLEEFVHFHVDLSAKVYSGLARQFNGAIIDTALQMIFEARWYPLYMAKFINDYQHYCAKELFMQQKGYPWDVIKGADRTRLSLANGPLVMEYLTASRLFKTTCNEIEFDHIIDIMFNDPDEEFGSKVKTSYLKVSKNGTLKPMPLVYESIYNPELLGLESEEDVSKHRTAATKLANVSMSTIPNTCDPIVIILTTCIILYTTDFVDLDDPKSVENVQSAYACLLWRYLKNQNYCNYQNTFGVSMMSSCYARELRETREKAYKRITSAC